MSTALLPAPQLADGSPAVEQHHVFCCDREVSLCGVDISDEPDCDETCTVPRCEFCERVLDQPCLNPKCVDRPRWWQVRR